MKCEYSTRQEHRNARQKYRGIAKSWKELCQIRIFQGRQIWRTDSCSEVLHSLLGSVITKFYECNTAVRTDKTLGWTSACRTNNQTSFLREVSYQEMNPYDRDNVYVATSKLKGEWSAPDFSKILTKDMVTDLVSRFDMLEPLVRMRLLLACMGLPTALREELQTELQVCHLMDK